MTDQDLELKKVGKRMPYQVPDGYFAQLQADVLAKVQAEATPVPAKPSRRKGWIAAAWGTAIAAAASVAIFVVVNDGGSTGSMATSAPAGGSVPVTAEVQPETGSATGETAQEQQPLLASNETAAPSIQPASAKVKASSPRHTTVSETDLDAAFDQMSEQEQNLVLAAYDNDVFLESQTYLNDYENEEN